MVLLIGCGEAKAFGEAEFIKVIRQCCFELSQLPIKQAILSLPALNKADVTWQIQQSIFAVESAHYLFNTFKSKETIVLPLKNVELAFSCEENLFNQIVEQSLAISDGMKTCKDLANTPPNICTPTFLADFAVKLAKQHPLITTTVLEESDMEALNMGGLLAVAKGSEQRA